MGQTRMRCAESIDRPNQIHSLLQRQRAARERATPGVPSTTVACDVDDAPRGRSASPPVRPMQTLRHGRSRGPLGSWPDWITKGLAHRANIGAQAIGTQQQRAMEGTGAHPLDQPPDQRHVALRAASPASLARWRPSRRRRPDNTPLSLDAYLVGCPLAESPRLLDEDALLGLALAASACPPRRDHPLVELKGHPNGLHGTAMGEQRHDQRHKVTRSARAVKDCPVRCQRSCDTVQMKRLACAPGCRYSPGRFGLWRDTPYWTCASNWPILSGR